jgi:hypothetical protein
VFMAGKTKVGVVGESARRIEVWGEGGRGGKETDDRRFNIEDRVMLPTQTVVKLTARLSHNPLEILASILAEQGATRTMSAQRLSCLIVSGTNQSRCWECGGQLLDSNSLQYAR